MEQKFFKFYNNEKTRLAFTIASAVIIAALSILTGYFLVQLLAVSAAEEGKFFAPTIYYFWRFLLCAVLDFVAVMMLKPFFGYQTIFDHIDTYKQSKKRRDIEKAERAADEAAFKIKQAEIRAEYKALAAEKKEKRKAEKAAKKA